MALTLRDVQLFAFDTLNQVVGKLAFFVYDHAQCDCEFRPKLIRQGWSLAEVVGGYSAIVGALGDALTDLDREALREAIYLVRRLATLLEPATVGQIHKVLGAPGDFGYETEIGSALDQYYRANYGAPRDTGTLVRVSACERELLGRLLRDSDASLVDGAAELLSRLSRRPSEVAE